MEPTGGLGVARSGVFRNSKGINMCGITGAWHRREAIDRSIVVRMRDALQHRGPDSEGLVVTDGGRLALAFRRLSILDLSTAADQPMTDPSGRWTIVFNGEIVNFEALRRELDAEGIVFRTGGDAEVLLQSYMRWGEGCLDRLRGMFAFAVWDGVERRLFIARDHLGIKPLYYYHAGPWFLFASELKGIMAHPCVRRDIDPDALEDYLTYGYVPFDRAIIRDAHKLPAGHCMTVDDLGVTVRRWWALEYRPESRSIDQTVDELRDRIAEAVDVWSISHVPVGVFLSGGIDSSAVCALAARNGRPTTFSIGFDDEQRNELGFARTVADGVGCDHHERIVSVHDAADTLDMLASVYDEPFYDTSAVPTLHLGHFASERVSVALGGDGGDEVFFGYNWYTEYLALARSSGRFIPGATSVLRALRRLPMGGRLAGADRFTTSDSATRYFGLIGFMDGVEKRRIVPGLAGGRSGDNLWLFRKFLRDDVPPATALRMLDMQTYLVDDILTKVDRASMAWSLEVRPPLLDIPLVEYVMTIPDELISPGDRKKHLFKKAMEGILPDSIIHRSKKGFSTPVRNWLRGDLSSVVVDRLLKGRLAEDGIIDPRSIQSMISTMTRNRWAKLWLLLMLEGWYRRWIREEMPGGWGPGGVSTRSLQREASNARQPARSI